jgi:hypothetical protein
VVLFFSVNISKARMESEVIKNNDPKNGSRKGINDSDQIRVRLKKLISNITTIYIPTGSFIDLLIEGNSLVLMTAPITM